MAQRWSRRSTPQVSRICPTLGSPNGDIFICGNNEGVKSVATELAEATSFDVADVGSLSYATLLESLAKLWAEMAYQRSLGRQFAFKMLRR